MSGDSPAAARSPKIPRLSEVHAELGQDLYNSKNGLGPLAFVIQGFGLLTDQRIVSARYV